jgi:hypothetical protein
MWAVIRAPHPENERAKKIKYSGIRVGEIIGYRAWRVPNQSWFKRGHERLCSVYISEFVWDPEKPAYGDVRIHGIYSFRKVVSSREEYVYSMPTGTLLFGKVKIWGEVVEHEWGYRSQFAKIISLDYGDPYLLDKFRLIYGVNLAPTSIWDDLQ